MFFDLNKCFLLPSAVPGIKGIKAQYQKHPASNLLIVGHTDTSGNEDFNATLSVERADAMAAYLTDKVPAWEAFFESSKPDEKRWGIREVQHMLSVLPDGGTPFLRGQGGRSGWPITKAAVKAFQKSEKLTEDGIAGPVTRKSLITRYMGIDETTLPAGITITTHGCGESFPVAKFQDGQRSPEDRRVEIYFFDGPIKPPAGQDVGAGFHRVSEVGGAGHGDGGVRHRRRSQRAAHVRAALPRRRRQADAERQLPRDD